MGSMLEGGRLVGGGKGEEEREEKSVPAFCTRSLLGALRRGKVENAWE